ncbi:MAG: rhodanese-like domain-containing protein [Myxococcota bacterium]
MRWKLAAAWAIALGSFWVTWPWMGFALGRAVVPGSVEWIEPDSLVRALGGDTPPLVLDVREPDEFAVSHIPGAIRFPPGSAMTDAIREAPLVVVYCSVGVRSGREAERLAESGVRVLNLEGAIFRWAMEGRPLVNAAGPTPFVHPYDGLWGRLLPAELHGWPR